MVTNDAGIIKLKHTIFEEVAKLAWEGKADDPEEREKIIYKIVPGPKATWRCCIYKEREIARQRIRLANAEIPTYNPGSENIVQVIDPACQECPIASYLVTDNCRLCMGKACQNSCKFGAITMGVHHAYIDPEKCRECGKCAQACPYSAIAHLQRPCKKACPVDAITYDEYGICKIDEGKCIQCGSCIHACPFGAIGSLTYLPKIIKHILAGDEVIAMCAPATEGQFGEDISMASVKNALKELGFADMVEVGLGGDMTAAYESEEWAEALKEGRKMTTSCCPAFINMEKKHFPKIYEENLSQTVSPMCAISRYLKATHPGCVTVFIGPCIAKKSEAIDKSVPDNADYAMTYGEFMCLLRSKNVELKPVEDEYQEASIWGKRFAQVGGVAAAVLECMEERGEDTSKVNYVRCSGGAECKKALTMLKFGRLKEDFVEGMACTGGCVGGPSKHKAEPEIKKARTKLLGEADKRGVLENLKNYPMDKFSMYRDGHMPE
ncbi:MAG: 4Fe-4S dicluster domain-containing protein [Lachnospiraceae bacterium]|nr:4Fe-4S dicluster domain-containing protein [Lachnospiraceae bacterium]